MQKWNSFFGSIVNTVLLVVLVVLMVWAIRVMLRNEDTYMPYLAGKQEEPKKVEPVVSLVTGRKDDLVSFSIAPGSKVHGVVAYTGTIKGGYFFEGNIIMHVLNSSKKHIGETHGTATSDWMTAGPVDFKGTLDFSSLPKGPAYIEIHNDNASGLPENEKSLMFPVVVE